MAFSFLSSKLYAPETIKCHYQNPIFLSVMSDRLRHLILKLDPRSQRKVVIFCIGSDRATGDCLGPLAGWFLAGQPGPYHLRGTLQSPVHAGNIEESLKACTQEKPLPLIIALDACLGKAENVGMINLGLGPIKPGSGVQKQLPAVGDIYFTGNVNTSSHLDQFVLQSTRLSLVMGMAEIMAASIHLALEPGQPQAANIPRFFT